jgi:hypothetical protein
VIIASAYAYDAIQIGTTAYHHTTGTNVTVHGMLFLSTVPGASTDVSIYVTYLNGSAYSNYTATTDNSGLFSRSFQMNTEGEFSVYASYSSTTSPAINFKVSNATDYIGETGAMQIEIPLRYGWFGNTTNWNSTRLYNGTLNASGTYYVIAENASDASGVYSCSNIFVDDDMNFNFSDSSEDGNGMTEIKYITQGDKFSINTTSYKVVFIDPKCTKAVLVTNPSSFFGGGENSTLVLEPVNSSGQPVNVSGNITYKIYNDEGELITNTTTNLTEWNYTVPGDAGNYYVYADGDNVGSFSVSKFSMKAMILDANGKEVSIVAPSTRLNITVTVINASSGSAISSAVVNATTTSGSVYTLTYSSSLGYYYATITAPSSGTEIYDISAAVAGQKQKTSLRIETRSFRISAFPMATEKGESDGFAPNQSAVIVITGTNMSDGSALNLSTLTSNCNLSKINLTSIINTTGSDLIGTVQNSINSMNITTALSLYNVPDFVREEMLSLLGQQACVINLSAPDKEGIYTGRIVVNVSGSIEVSDVPITVQEIFAKASPMDIYDSFKWYVSPSESVYLKMNVLDAATGSEIAASNITSVSLIEVITENGTIVTASMLNESFSNSLTVGWSSSSQAALSFVVNDSIMGGHMVRFMAKVRVQRGNTIRNITGVGSGWFMEKKYHVFGRPETSGGNWFFGTNSNITFVVEVYDSTSFSSFGQAKSGNESGSSSLQNIAVVVDEVRDQFTWKKIDFSSTSGTTDSRGQARVNITPTTSWPTGNYNVRIKITKSGVEDYGFSWFEVKSFNFWAWTNNWQVGARQAVPITASVSYTNWTSVSGASVNITKILYHGKPESGMWVSSEVSFNASAANTSALTSGSGMATVVIPQNTVTKSGQYEAVLTATLPSGSSQTSMTWFNVKSFVIFLRDFTRQDVWNPSYRAGQNITVNITGGTSMNWTKWPIPIDGSKNISAAWVTTIEKEGMFGPFMKKDTRGGAQQTITQSHTCNGQRSICQINISTAGMDEGRYHAIIMANDTDGSEENEWFNFEIKSFTITTPEFKRVMVKTISNYTYTNASSIIANSSWSTCSNDQVSPPSSVKECKAMTAFSFTEDPSATQYSVLFDINSTNASVRRLYISTNASSLNFTNVSIVSNYSIGQNFSIAGIWYKIVNITDSVKLESNNTVGADNDGNGRVDYDKYGSGCQNRLCVLNVSDSSGKYYLQRDEWNSWDGFADNDWLGIDLNGDGDTWDSYFLAVQTYSGGSMIKNVYANNVSTFRAGTGVKTYPGSAPANFSPSGTPIYYVGASYNQQSGTTGSTSTGSTLIEVVFTSNRTGWMGMDIGTFKVGTNVSIPVLVLDSDKTAISGAIVNISRAVLIDSGPPTEITLSNSSVSTTDSRGVAVVTLNSTWFTNPFTGSNTGRYAIKVTVNSSGTVASSSGQPWEWPKVEIANFRLRVEPGMMGQITGLKKLSASIGTLARIPSYEAVLDKGLPLQTACGNSNVLQPTDWRYQKLKINKSFSNTTVIIDNDGDCIVTGSDAGDTNISEGSILTLSQGSYTEYLNVSDISLSGSSNFTLRCTNCGSENTSQQSRYFELGGKRYYLKYVLCASNQEPSVQVERRELEWNWNWDMVGSPGSSFFWDWRIGDYELDLTSIQNNSCSSGNPNANVTFTARANMLLLKNPWNLNLGGSWKAAKIANSSATGAYQIVVFDDNSTNNGENAMCAIWGNTCTRADKALLINSTGGVNATYYYGDFISQLNMSLMGGQLWEDKLLLANITGPVPFPIDWYADNTEEFWIGNFTETDIQQDLNSMSNCMNEQAIEPNASQSYNIMLYDNRWDGSSSISGGMYDNDRDMFERCTWNNGQVCYDLYGSAGKTGGLPLELGENRTMGNCGGGPGGPGEPFSEQWVQLGEDRWPITFLSLNTSNATNGVLVTQTKKEVFNLTKGERVSFAIRASNLDGSSFTGNASVTEAFDMKNFIPLTPPNDTVNIVNGEAVLTLNNFTNVSNGGYIMRVHVCDNSIPAVCQDTERSVFIGSMTFMACKEGEMCEGSSGGGGGMGGPM